MSDSPPPTVPSLFWNFFVIGLCGFGGVGPWARRMIVEQRRWMTAAEFTDLLGLCQFLPGGNVMNLTIAFGSRCCGIPGAIAAFVGLMAAPVAVVIGLGVLYDQYATVPAVHRGFLALAAAASALVLANALKIAAPLRTHPLGAAIALATVLAVAALRLPLLIAMPALALLSTALLWRVRT
jgi:chromate transporter